MAGVARAAARNLLLAVAVNSGAGSGLDHRRGRDTVPAGREGQGLQVSDGMDVTGESAPGASSTTIPGEWPVRARFSDGAWAAIPVFLPSTIRKYTMTLADRIPVVYHDAHSDWIQSVAEVGFVGTAAHRRGRGSSGPLDKKAFADQPAAFSSSGLGCVLVGAYAWIEFPFFGNVAVVLAWWLCFSCAVQYVTLVPAPPSEACARHSSPCTFGCWPHAQ